MSRRRLALALVGGLCVSAVRASAQGVSDGSDGAAGPRASVEVADSLRGAGQVEAALRLLEERLAAAPDDFEARWRAARAAVSLGILATGTEVENRWYRVGIRHSDLALADRPDDLEALRWAVAGEGNLAVQTGAREAARMADRVWKHAHHVLDLSPDDPVAHYALGKLQYEVLALNGVERLLARVFGGNGPERSSWPDALAHAELAVRRDPSEALFRLGLADILWHLGRREEAIAQLQVAQGLPLRDVIDSDFRGRATLMLARIHEGRDP